MYLHAASRVSIPLSSQPSPMIQEGLLRRGKTFAETRLNAVDTADFRFNGQPTSSSLLESMSNGVRGFFSKTWMGIRYVAKYVAASISYLIAQAKRYCLFMLGVLAFFPLGRVRAWVERMAVFPTAKIWDYPFKNADILRNAYTEIRFNMGGLLKTKAKALTDILKLDPKADDIKLRAWHIPPKNPQMPTVLFHQERASNMSCHGSIMRHLKDKGYGVFLYNYPGYGSEGRIGEAAANKAGVAAALKLAELGVPISEQVQMGYSLGTSVACTVTNGLQKLGMKPKALVLVNSFPSLKEMVKYNVENNVPWFPRCLIGDKAIGRIQTELNCAKNLKPLNNMPTLFLQGEKDQTAPKKLVQKMADEMLQTPAEMKQIVEVPEAKHILKERDYLPIVDRFDTFMSQQHLKSPLPV